MERTAINLGPMRTYIHTYIHTYICRVIVLHLSYLYSLLITSLSFMFCALGSADVKRVISKLFLEPLQCLLNLEARLIPLGIILIFNYTFQYIIRFITIHTIFTMFSNFAILYTNSPCFTSSITHFVIRGIFTSVNGIDYTFTLLSPPFPLRTTLIT